MLQNTPTFKQTGHQAAKYSIYTTYNQTLTKTKTNLQNLSQQYNRPEKAEISLICSTTKQRNLHIHLLLNTPALKNAGPQAAWNSKQQTLQLAIHPNTNENQNKSAV